MITSSARTVRSSARRAADLCYAVEAVERRLLLAVTATFTPATGVLFVSGDAGNNNIVVSRSVAGALLVNGGAVAISGGSPTVANTVEIFVSASDGNDQATIDETNGSMPAATLSGGNNNDTLIGGSGNDLLIGEAGDDTLLGKGGVDTLDGGAGNDVLTGGAGNDSVIGGSENDRLIWNPGDGSDVDEAGTGTDTIEVNGDNVAESFTITPNGTRVRVDRVTPTPFSLDINAAENLTLNCNGGADTVAGSNGLAALIALTVDGGSEADSITGGDGVDMLLGGDGNDTITPGRGNDVVLAGAGNDLMVWNPGDGSDTDEGQGDVDTLQFNGANIAENIAVSANGGRVRLTRDVANIVMDLNGIEGINIAALGGADTITVGDLTGTDLPAVTVDLAAFGGSGDGAADNVIVNGTAGIDSAVFTGTAGNAMVLGLPSQTIVLHPEPTLDRLSVNTQAGNDFVSASTLQVGVILLTVDGGTDNDSLVGSLDADSLLGNAGNDTLVGGPGNDFISGDAGNDQLVWNPGDGSDTDEGGTETDTAVVNGDPIADSFTVTANGTRVRLDRLNLTPFTLDIGTTENLTVNGNAGADTIVAGNGLSALIALTLDGGSENDSITGGDGADVILGGAGADLITPGRGNDVAFGGSEDDTFVWNPGDGSDILEGQAGADTMNFNGANISEQINVQPNGSRVRFTRDVAAITMDLDGVESIHYAALGGADAVTVADMAGTDLSDLLVDLGASGGTPDGAADTVTVNGLASGGAVRVRNADPTDAVSVNPDGVGTARVVFDVPMRMGTLSVASGGVAALASSLAGTPLGVTALNLSGSGKFDLGTQNLILDYPAPASPIGTVRSQLQTGFAGGAWTGSGILSSAAAAAPATAIGYAEATSLFTTFPATWKGQSVDNTSLLLSYTLKGDADLNRTVDFNDLLRLAKDYNVTSAAATWFNGDFNYDAAVNFSDLLALAKNYNATIAPAAVAPSSRRVAADVLGAQS